MKKINLVLLIAIIATLFSPEVIAQKKGKVFTGVITYIITYPDSDLDETMSGMLPEKMTVYISETKKKNKVISAMSNQSEIVDAEAMTRTTLIDIMGQKFAILHTKEDIEAELLENPEPVINFFDETKEIAGYTCRKAELISTDETKKDIIVTLYYTDELKNQKVSFDGEFRNLDGIPLEFTVKPDRMNMRFTASEVSHEKVKDKEFEISEDYKFVTEDDLRKMFGG
jgi:GLPGLI family protein